MKPESQKQRAAEDEHLSSWESFFNPLAEEYRKLLNWVKPDFQKNMLLEILKLIYKLPVLIVISLLTPVAFLIVVIVFFATL